MATEGQRRVLIAIDGSEAAENAFDCKYLFHYMTLSKFYKNRCFSLTLSSCQNFNTPVSHPHLDVSYFSSTIYQSYRSTSMIAVPE